MNHLLALSRQIDRISQTAAQLAVLLVLVCALISVGNALSRYAFDLSSNAWLEMQWYLFAGIVMLGLPIYSVLTVIFELIYSICALLNANA